MLVDVPVGKGVGLTVRFPSGGTVGVDVGEPVGVRFGVDVGTRRSYGRYPGLVLSSTKIYDVRLVRVSS